MKHGRSIVAALLGTALLIGSLSGCGSTEPSGGSDGEYQKINLSMAVNGTDTQIDSLVAHHFADLVEERSGGNVVIDVFSNDTTGGAYYAKLLEAKGITYLGSFHNGFRQLTNSKHPVTKPEDLKDLKIRVPGSAVYMGVFNALGASPTAMSWSEVFTAIQQKTIDGQENGCSVTKSAKMDEIQQYMTIWNYSYENDLFVANSRVWESLDENTRQLLQECATESCEWGRDHLEAEEDQLIQGFMDSGMQVDILTEDQLQAFKDAVAGVTADLKAEYGEDACAAFGIN